MTNFALDCWNFAQDYINSPEIKKISLNPGSSHCTNQRKASGKLVRSFDRIYKNFDQDLPILAQPLEISKTASGKSLSEIRPRFYRFDRVSEFMNAIKLPTKFLSATIWNFDRIFKLQKISDSLKRKLRLRFVPLRSRDCKSWMKIQETRSIHCTTSNFNFIDIYWIFKLQSKVRIIYAHLAS